MRRIMAVFTLLVVFVTTGLCPKWPCCAGPAWALSVDEEQEIGREFMAQIREYFTLLEDDFANRYLNGLGRYLVEQVETQPFPFHFYIIKDPTLNAFAAPGGQIFIFSGLVGALDQVDELAAVICHEIGHVTARHLAQRIEQNKKIGLITMAGILAGALLGGTAAEALIAGSMAAGIQAQLHYSREDERQADQLGFKYMSDSGFDPHGMEETLKEIAKGNWLGSDKIPAYLLTHPTGPERMANLETLLSGYAGQTPSPEAEQFRKVYPLFRTVVMARSIDNAQAERLFRADLDKDPSDPLPYVGLGILALRKRDYPTAIDFMEKALERGKDYRLALLTYLGQAYQMSGRDQDAVRTLKESLSELGENSTALYYLGLSYQNLGQYTQSADIFERLAVSPAAKDDVYYHLGIAYGRLNRLAEAHYNFGLYFSKLNQTDKARFHFEKAKELSADHSILAQKISLQLQELEKAEHR